MDFEEWRRRMELSPQEAWDEARALIAQEREKRTGVVDLSGFKIDALPQEIADLIWLTALGCSGASVSDLGPLQGLSALQVFYCNSCPIIEIPHETLSHHYYDNCLPRLRSWRADAERGTAPYRERKVFLLGNGTVGKTQVLRQLCGQGFDASAPSTHGIQLHDHDLPDGAGDRVPVRFWDFGGQDIYHGTHALFLKSRAIFLLCWNPVDEAKPFHTIDGVDYRNRPLAYWLDYVRELAGPDAPVIVVETKCDSGEPIAIHPVGKAQRGTFQFLRHCATSASEQLGFDALRKQIGQAVAHLEARGVPQITAPAQAVKAALVADVLECIADRIGETDFDRYLQTAFE